MIVKTLTLLAVLSLFPLHAGAEYYKYKDANGVLRFTDNLLEVPENQRGDIQAYQEVVTPEPEAVAPEDAEAAMKDRNSRIEQLNNEREKLEQAYKNLETERALLMESPPDPQDQEAYEAYKGRVEAFNEKIKAYEEQRKQFQSEIDAFNASLEE